MYLLSSEVKNPWTIPPTSWYCPTIPPTALFPLTSVSDENLFGGGDSGTSTVVKVYDVCAVAAPGSPASSPNAIAAKAFGYAAAVRHLITLPFLLILGLILVRQGRREEARPFFEKALEANPAFAPASQQLSKLASGTAK